MSATTALSDSGHQTRLLAALGAAVALALLFTVISVISATAGTSERSEAACAAGFCTSQVAQSADPDREIRLAGRFRSKDQFRRQRIRQCCQRYVRGQPLKGYLCSAKVVNFAVRDGICHLPFPPPPYYGTPLLF